MKKYFYFLNRRNIGEGFKESVHSKFFVDKSMLIELMNQKIGTKEKWICVSRPRRFGKTMALEMLAAYYTKGITTDTLFDALDIKKNSSFSYYQHLNSHNVIYINFNDFFENVSVSEGIAAISERLIKDLRQAYPELIDEEKDLVLCLDMIQQICGERFIFLIDEWDCVFRFRREKVKEQTEFLSFLKVLFKDKPYVELVYMTGILPIKKYSTGSALNMFREYTMLEPKRFAPYFGFSKSEITQLLVTSDTNISLEELGAWYDGYTMPGYEAVYNPRSVVEALEENCCRDYWNKTGGFSELEEYITMNFDGLGECVTQLVAGEKIPVNVVGFSNDLDSFRDRDEVLTALIHLGYLSYENGCVYIPNKEISEEFANTIKKLSWGVVSKLLNQSKNLLQAVLDKKAEEVAYGLECVHDGMQEFKEYNNEHTLKCVIHLAFYAAADNYKLNFEVMAGKGYADCVFLPKKKGLPGIVMELKYNRSAQEAIQQINAKGYTAVFEENVSCILLVGINYDKKTKMHQCVIEEVNKE